MVDGGYPVIALVRLKGNAYSENVCFSSIGVFLESEGVEEAVEPDEQDFLLHLLGIEVSYIPN